MSKVSIRKEKNDMTDTLKTFEDILARDGKLVYKTRGVSMEPMLRQNRDLVVIEVPKGRLKRFDVALYKRKGSYVLHRVIHVRERDYLIRGDNTYYFEEVPDEAVIGVLAGFQRKGKYYDITNKNYQRYVHFWNAVYPLRALRFHTRRSMIRTARKWGILPILKKIAGR